MIIYNVTINIQEGVHDEWLEWMKQTHIPEVLATGKFGSARLVRVLVDEEMGGVTYSAQYTTDSRDKLQQYYEQDSPVLRQKGLDLFGDKMLAFRTELEVIAEY